MRGTGFVLFGLSHLAILASVPALAYLLGQLARRSGQTALRIRLIMGSLLLANEVVWYWYRYSIEGFRFPENLPLQLCDLTLLMTGLAALTGSVWAFDIAYYAGVGGASMAIITPDLWAPWPSYPSIYYFIAHGGMVATTLTLIWGNITRPAPGSLWRAFALVNLYAAVVGIFNWIFGTNYMYLCRKPASATLLDAFGSWPVYLIACEMFALMLFGLMWLPFARGTRRSVATAD
jgi:hypothetical integral membrane protein (TIGR02206 family)